MKKIRLALGTPDLWLGFVIRELVSEAQAG
jgi:hypothetical protein